MHDLAFSIRTVRATCLRAPLDRPMRNAFGAIDNRPALLIELELDDGVTGLGEVFCNFPVFSQFHKARIINEMLGPMITGASFDSPEAMSNHLARVTHRIALQSGEPGPFSQVIAGLDVAAWDAVAQRAGTPLWRLLAPDAHSRVLTAYASGIDSVDIQTLIPPLQQAGWRAYKLKVGFGAEEDRRGLGELRAAAGPDASLMVDANQAWDFSEAERQIRLLADEGLHWIEEPIAADRPSDEWSVLAEIGPAIAGGENIRGDDGFELAIDAGIEVLQPDVIKWGGISGTVRIAQMARKAGILWAPHYLASGVGLAASAHVAVACDAGFMEFDVNPNPLREGLLGGAVLVEDGQIHLADRSGHGAIPDPEVIARYRV
ncbi:mandelate racemase/muconate lactonizing enzyme family protein [Acuticoccus sp. MNP-M23]|uniref:mandelate racemase/muconate lactonizing enzyme family protein n=1 Tax=Acuticoccus sp. MNP-M23 TaxID=3072793 RepID=UPI002815CC5C|nr:mandelate racemase/muconate lactonizing enzyme family protein [Acuticoccus sp. MNP-M23]WMS43668.1 mandelate racemase/muconate lactonizing enzyme family protein [Acuticoccus sp. MNP-M23]